VDVVAELPRFVVVFDGKVDVAIEGVDECVLDFSFVVGQAVVSTHL
jgi:hypothetical protein